MIAIVSDIHGNLEALTAALADVRSLGIREVVCLGDIVGYGPNPLECLRLTPEFKVVLKGNHDAAAVSGEHRFSHVADKAMTWTRSALADGCDPDVMDFMRELPETRVREGLFFAHASPREPLREYIYPAHVKNVRKMQALFRRVRKYAFVGHTHIPGVIEEGSDEFIRPAEPQEAHFLGRRKAIINVGSVGQPRDGDPRACYVTFDGTAVVFRRVWYDCSPTVKKIREIPGLDDSLALRLEQGR